MHLAALNHSTCDGSRVLFIGGFHHSGTGIITHALKVRALGRNSPGIDVEVRDHWPPTSQALLCTETWSVWKKPTNSVHEVHMMLGLRKIYPNMTLVFIERDLPNVAWSLAKRFKTWKSFHLTNNTKTHCDVRHAWHEAQRRHNHTADFAIDLQEFSRAPRRFVERVIPTPTLVSAPPPPPPAGAGNASGAASGKLLREVHYGANRAKTEHIDAAAFSDAELGVMYYRPWHFISEVESPLWQGHMHDPHLWGSHGVTDLANVSTALAALECAQPLHAI